jgi:membrane associated rhomboid family serine protease
MFPLRTSVPTRYPPTVTWTLIAANCVIFLFQISLSPAEQEWFLVNFALIPARYFAPEAFGLPEPTLFDYLPFASNMFLHGGWLHLILNMWTLWLFGPVIEDRFGPGRYLMFYLVCGIAASAAHAMFNPISVVPALGASGAIAGVMGAFLRLFPFARVIVLVPVLFLPLFFELHAVIYVGFWFLVQIFQGTFELFMRSTDGGGVAWWAHIGGFVVGFAFGSLLQPPRRAYRPYYADEGVYGFTPLGYR